MSESHHSRINVRFPVKFSEHQVVAGLMGVASVGALFLSYYYDSLEHAQKHQHYHYDDNDIWYELRDKGLTNTLKTNRTFGLSIFIGVLFLFYILIFYFILSH